MNVNHVELCLMSPHVRENAGRAHAAESGWEKLPGPEKFDLHTRSIHLCDAVPPGKQLNFVSLICQLNSLRDRDRNGSPECPVRRDVRDDLSNSHVVHFLA